MILRYGTIQPKYNPRFIYLVGFVLYAWISLATTAPVLAAKSTPIKLLAFGDSLTAGYGLAAPESFPQQLQKTLRDIGYKVSIQNAGVSGDTATGGLARLDWSLAEPVDGIIVELGANDALRGISPDATRTALDKIMQQLRARKIEILMAGMLAPPNMGAEYVKSFNTIYPQLAQKHNALLYPFFLEGIMGTQTLLQADGLHPTADGIKIIVQNILPKVEELLQRIQHKSKIQP